jgi:hypothetical protein
LHKRSTTAQRSNIEQLHSRPTVFTMTTGASNTSGFN